MRVLLVLAALLLLLPAATAQSAPQPCGPIGYDKITVPAPLAADAEGEVSIVVKNTNTLQPASVVVSVATTTVGWTIKTSEQTISVPASGQTAAKFTVSPTKDAKGDLTINFSATATCTGPGGQACPGPLAAQCVNGPINTSGVVPLAAPGGFAFPGFSNIDFPIEYVIATVVLISLAVAIPLLIRKRKPGLFADCPEPLKMVRPGRGTSFPIDIRNPSTDALTAAFEVGPVPEGWSAFMPLPEVQLAPREARSLWLMVRAPSTAATGSTADVEVRLHNAAKPESKATVKVRAEVNPDAPEGPRAG
jgi:hypothetical protein